MIGSQQWPVLEAGLHCNHKFYDCISTFKQHNIDTDMKFPHFKYSGVTKVKIIAHTNDELQGLFVKLCLRWFCYVIWQLPHMA